MSNGDDNLVPIVFDRPAKPPKPPARCEHDARHPKPSHLDKIGPSGRAPSAVPPRRCFFVEPASVRRAAKES
jgi:hypothetical protein